MVETTGLVDPFPGERLDEAYALLARHVSHPGFDRLAELHGVALPQDGDVMRRLDAIAEVSDQFWDLRGRQGGKERQEVNWSDVPGLEEVTVSGSKAWETVFAVADDWDMVQDTTPAADALCTKGARYTLGAAATSALARVQYTLGHEVTPVSPASTTPLPAPAVNPLAHPALQDEAGLVIALGTHRPLNTRANEHAAAEHFMSGAKTESDLMLGAFKHELQGRYHERTYQFNDAGYAYVEGDCPRLTELSVDDGNLVVLCLHAPEPLRTEFGRAQTPHTYRLMSTVLRDHVQLEQDATLLGVSNAIYVPFQGAAALNAFRLREGWNTDMIGFGHETAGTNRLAAQFLPEFRSYELQLRHIGAGILATAQS